MNHFQNHHINIIIYIFAHKHLPKPQNDNQLLFCIYLKYLSRTDTHTHTRENHLINVNIWQIIMFSFCVEQQRPFFHRITFACAQLRDQNYSISHTPPHIIFIAHANDTHTQTHKVDFPQTAKRNFNISHRHFMFLSAAQNYCAQVFWNVYYYFPSNVRHRRRRHTFRRCVCVCCKSLSRTS